MNKKIFLIFVEGTTDQDCLQPIMDYYRLYSKLSNIDIEVVNGDLFTAKVNNTKNGQKILKEQVEHFFKISKLRAKDIVHVAFITDTDGIYINPNQYKIDPSITNFSYNLQDKQILCKDDNQKVSINQSRQTKARKLADVIQTLDKSFLTFNKQKLSYSIYYNSLNLEHVLFDTILPNKEKRPTLEHFLDQIEDDPQQLIKQFTQKSLGTEYIESWKEIQSKEMDQGYTNLHLLFEFESSIMKLATWICSKIRGSI